MLEEWVWVAAVFAVPVAGIGAVEFYRRRAVRKLKMMAHRKKELER